MRITISNIDAVGCTSGNRRVHDRASTTSGRLRDEFDGLFSFIPVWQTGIQPNLFLGESIHWHFVLEFASLLSKTADAFEEPHIAVDLWWPAIWVEGRDA